MPTATRIEDHALLGNTGSAALVRTDGTVNWLCLPSFDSPAVFASLLGTNEHGFWRIGPAAYDGTAPPPATRRRYAGSTLILEQEWDTPSGSVRVTDFMPAPYPDGETPRQVVRIARGLTGTVRVASVFRPRPGYGAHAPRIHRTDDHGAPRLCASNGQDAFWLDGPLHSAGRRGVCRADVELVAGHSVTFALTWKPSHLQPPPLPDAWAELAATKDHWEQWTSDCTYRGPDRDAVLRAALTLKAMCHPGGGIVAAPTTSLPEQIGGERNWDYRYAWIRDSALTVASLLRLGFTQEALAWRDWLTEVINPSDLRAIYRLDSWDRLDEQVLDHLPGYEGSRPVRVGNGAADQLQLDVYGELAEALLLADDAGLPANPGCDALLLALAQRLEALWGEPDEGIWEIRGPRRHFVHSKVMAWVCTDRTVSLMQRRPAADPAVLDRLRALREAIHQDVCEHGFDPERNTFTQFYGGRELDAALLLIPQVGFLPPDDKRVIGTVEAVQRELSTKDGFLLRYPTHDRRRDNVDGLSGHEGAFLACSFWLADALTLIGRTTEARDLFDRLLALRNGLGLLAEEYDPLARRQLGNFPQAFSMWALADTARTLSRPVSDTAPRRRPQAALAAIG
ncbi:glycoside hydrolase family 15 protein [Kitasatospora sp. NPDC001574]